MLATGLRAIQITLLAVCAYLLYLSLSPLVGAAPIPETNLPQVEPPRPPAQDFPRYQIISDRNLFHTPDAAETGPAEEEFEESKLRLRLLGTTAAVPREFSVATVEDLAKNQNVSLRENDWVSGAQVVRIERRRIVVDNRGTLEQLTLEEAEKTASALQIREMVALSKRSRECLRKALEALEQ